MKRILSLLLCLVLLTMALASCSDDTPPPTKVDRPNLTLRMAMVVDDKTTAEGVAAMQKAFNDECKVLLSTQVVFECIKASEYKERMTAIMQDVQAARRQDSANKEDNMANGAVVDINAYPDVKNTQFDILLIADREMYEEFVENGWIVGLKGHLSANFKVTATKMMAPVRAAATLGGEIYGIPANKAYGTYQYVVVNNEALAEYNMDADDIHSLADAYGILTSMKIATGSGKTLAYWQEKYGSDFAVIAAKEENFNTPNVKFLSRDFTTPSFIGSSFGFDTTMDYMLASPATNLLKDANYTRFLTMKYDAKKSGYFGTGSEENFLIGLAEGDYALRNSKPGYTFCPIMLPEVGNDEVFGGMLAVSNFSVDQKRSMEIVQEFMTDATGAGLLNIALFGDDTTNYFMENGAVKYRNMSNYGVHKDYMFGNLREFAYPCADYGQTADTYLNAAAQITDTGSRMPLFNEDFAAYFAEVDLAKWQAADELSKTTMETLMNSADMDKFLENIEVLAAELDADENFTALVNAGVGDDWTLYDLGGAFHKYILDRLKGTSIVEK